MNTIKVKILAMAVIHESNIPKQEKIELLDFVNEVKDLRVLKSVLESYGLLEDGEENIEDPGKKEEHEEEEKEEIDECQLKDLDEDEELEETLMGPLKTPRDEDISETKMGPLKNPHDEDLLEKIGVPSILERKRMTGAVYNWLKSQKDRPSMKTPSASQYIKPGLRTRLSKSLVRIRPTPSPIPALS